MLLCSSQATPVQFQRRVGRDIKDGDGESERETREEKVR